ncbi:MAG: substrate-binding domain-containing protein [Chloroflexota bacterium]
MGILTQRRRGAALGCIVVLFLLLAGCRAEQPQPVPITLTPPPTVLRIGTADTAVAFTDLVAIPYAQYTDRASLQIIPGNTTALFADLEAGQLDAILVHHIAESAAVWFSPVAVDGLVIIVHPDNPVTNLSRGEVQAVFNGRIANWSALGGPDAPITLVSRERGSGTRAIFVERVMGEQRVSINAVVAAGDTPYKNLLPPTPMPLATA